MAFWGWAVFGLQNLQYLLVREDRQKSKASALTKEVRRLYDLPVLTVTCATLFIGFTGNNTHIFTQVFQTRADTLNRLCGGLGFLRQYPHINKCRCAM